MHVGIVMLIVMHNGVDNRLRFLRGRRAVQINQRPAVHLLLQSRKLRANLLYVKAHRLVLITRHTGRH